MHRVHRRSMTIWSSAICQWNMIMPTIMTRLIPTMIVRQIIFPAAIIITVTVVRE